jgi:hypothetical protein
MGAEPLLRATDALGITQARREKNSLRIGFLSKQVQLNAVPAALNDKKTWDNSDGQGCFRYHCDVYEK